VTYVKERQLCRGVIVGILKKNFWGKGGGVDVGIYSLYIVTY
jgi:hypothetical protein